MGTPQTLSNELGECVWEIKQDTWGTALEINTSDNLLEQTNLRFQGQYYDKETGLHYNRYRYYEPYSARYVSKDPIGLFGGLHSTKYVSDPNQWVDPMGLQQRDSSFLNLGSYENVKQAQETYEKYKDSKNVKDVVETYATGKSVGASLTLGVGIGGAAHYHGDGQSSLTLEQKIGIGYDYGVFEREEIYGQKELNKEYIQGCAATGETKYCAGSHTDRFSPYVLKDSYAKGKARGVTIERGKQMSGNPNGPSIIHQPVGHTWDLGAHGFPSR